jgi:hypothetical protein
MAKKPIAVSLIACEQVIFENRTLNCTPVNCFARRTVERVPSDPFPFVVFALVTNGVGEVTFDLRIERLDTLEEVHHQSATGELRDALQEYRCLFRVRHCSFPVAGHYQILLFADRELIAQRRLTILARGNVS